MIKDHEDNKKQAFICFETGEQAYEAIQALNGTFIEGCDEKLVVTELLSKQERNEVNLKNFKKIKDHNLSISLTQNLYVKGIPTSCTKEDIEKEFSQFGPVKSIKLNMKPTAGDKSKQEFVGSAFVCFESADDARKAIYEGSMKPLFGQNLFIDYYKPKEFKKKEKVEELGIAMKKMLHGFMMAAMAQSQGFVDYDPSSRGRYSRGGRYRGGHSNYTHKQKPAQYARYSYGGDMSNPPLPGSGALHSSPHGVPLGMPPVGSASGVPPISAPPVGLLSQGPPIAGVAFSSHGSAPPPPPPQSFISKSELEGLEEDEKRNFIGERIYPLIEEKYNDNAPKITGMIIDMEYHQVMSAISSKQALMDKAKEAYELLVQNGDAVN